MIGENFVQKTYCKMGSIIRVVDQIIVIGENFVQKTYCKMGSIIRVVDQILPVWCCDPKPI